MRSSSLYNLTKDEDYSLNSFGVYSIKSNISNKRYIGSTTKSFRDRWILHYCQLINKNHYNIKLQNHVVKHGINDLEFSIIEIINDKNICREREKYWIDKYDVYKNGFNLSNETDISVSGESHHLYKKVDKELIKRLYVTEKHSTTKIAKFLNVGKSKIINTLKELNIERSNCFTILPLKEIYYRNLLGGEKLKDLAMEFNVPYSTIRRQFKKNGFKNKMEILEEKLPTILEYYKSGGNIVKYCEKMIFSHDSVYRRLPNE